MLGDPLGTETEVILHDFEMAWQDADDDERAVLAAEEPEPDDARWDAFLAAYVKHLCHHAEPVLAKTTLGSLLSLSVPSRGAGPYPAVHP